MAKYHTFGIKDQTKHNCKTSQNCNQESNLTRKWKYHKIVIKNQIYKKMEISQNSNQESNVTKMRNITNL